MKERSGKPVVCTLQARPLYTDEYHVPARRRAVLDPAEFAESLQVVADGAMVFAWTDSLNRIATGEPSCADIGN